MKVFMSEDNLCAQNLLKLVSHGNAIVAEILRLKDHKPSAYLLDNRESQQKYQDVILDFSYFKISDAQEKKINANPKLLDLDDELKEKYLEIINRFYLLFENIYQYIVDLNSFVEQLHDGTFIQQNIETVLKDVEGKQLLCESLYLYGAMLLLCDLYIPGPMRERLLVAFYRYSTSQSQSNIDDVCKLLRDTGYDQQNGRRPADYPVEYFSRVFIRPEFVEKVVGKLRSEDIYNQLAVYTIPEHQASALGTQASMLAICLFFTPYYLHTDTSKMREIVDKFFPTNWVIPVYMGVTMNIIDYWENFKAAKSALSNTCNSKMIKEVFAKRGGSVPMLTTKTHQLLKEGTLTDDFVLDNISKILNLLLNSNLVLRWLLLHNTDVTFYDNNKKSKQLKDLVLKESNYDPLKILELLISTAELELKVREILNRLLENRESTWNMNKNLAIEALNSLAELFSGAKPVAKIQENEQLRLWFDSIAKQVSSLGEPSSSKSIKKVTQLLQALDEVEEFHGIKSTSTIVQYLCDSKDALKNLLRAASLKEDSLVTLETVADVSYAWCTIDLYTKHMQDSIKENPAVTSRLRALFLKLASAMEIPLLRINQAHSDDLVSVSQYFSNELIKYIQKVLQIIPEMVFNIVEKIIDLQTWAIKEVPTRLEKERLRDYAQLEDRMEVAKLTHSASTFTTGILDMRSTLVGVIRVDPAELLEEGLLKELDRHISKKFVEFLEPQGKKYQPTASNLMSRLQKLAESMDGYRRSLEYIQDYINIHGLRIWQKQITAIITESVSKEISFRKGVTLYSPSAGFMGSLARQIPQLVDARICSYVNVCAAWYDVKTQNEIINNKTFGKLNEAIGVVGLHGLDTLYGFMVKNQMHNVQDLFRNSQDKFLMGNMTSNMKDLEHFIAKGYKTFQQLSDVLVLIGTLQIIRRHIAYQLNTSCKFDSAQLEASLRTMNESLINELKISTHSESQPKVSSLLLQNLEEYLVRCGIYEPYDKIYVKHAQEFLNADMGRILVALLISQLPRLQICYTTGDLITRRTGDNIDGYPLLVGIYSLLRQSKTENVAIFIESLCTYVNDCIGKMEAVEEPPLLNTTVDNMKVTVVFDENNENDVASVATDVCHKSNGVAESESAEVAAVESNSVPSEDSKCEPESAETSTDVNDKTQDIIEEVAEAAVPKIIESTDTIVEHSQQTTDDPSSTIEEPAVVKEVITVTSEEETVVEVDNTAQVCSERVTFQTEILIETNDNDMTETITEELVVDDQHSNNLLSELGQSIELSEALRSSDVSDSVENNNSSVRQEVFNKEELLDILEGNDEEQSESPNLKNVSSDKILEATIALQQLNRLKSANKKRGTNERLPRNRRSDKIEKVSQQKQKVGNTEENIVNVLVKEWDDEEMEGEKTNKLLQESEDLLKTTEDVVKTQEIVTKEEEQASARSSIDSSSDGKLQVLNKSSDEGAPQRRLGRVIKKKVIFDPDNPDTFTKSKAAAKSKEPSMEKDVTPSKKIKTEPTFQRTKSKSPIAKLQWKKPSPKNCKQNKRLTEVDKLLMDEGAVNMIYQLTPEAQKGKKNMKTKAEFIKKLQSSTPVSKEMKFRERKKESKYEEGEAKKILGGKQRSSLNSSVKSPSVCEDFEAHSADDSIIYRRHSSSSYSSSCMSPRRLSDVESGSRNPPQTVQAEVQNQSAGESPNNHPLADVFMSDNTDAIRPDAINKDDCLSIKEKLNSKLNLALNKRKREIIKGEKPSKIKKLMKSDEKSHVNSEDFKYLSINFDQRLAEICVQKAGSRCNIEMLKELEKALQVVEAKKDISVTLLSSECATAYSDLDLRPLLDENTEKSSNFAYEMAESVRSLLETVEQHGKLLCAGVNGRCSGVGLALIGLCDVALASERASFAISPKSHGGVAPIEPGAAAFTTYRLLPQPLLNDLIVFGRRLSASEALRGGLVSRTLWPDNFGEQVQTIVKDIALQPARNIWLKKRILNMKKSGSESTFLGYLEKERNLLVEYWTSTEGQDILRATYNA